MDAFFIFLFRFLFGYIRSSISLFFIVPVVGMSIFVYTWIWGTDVSWLSHLSFIDKKYMNTSVSLDTSDIMKTFGVIALALECVTLPFQKFFRTTNRLFVIQSMFIVLIFILAFISLSYRADLAPGSGIKEFSFVFGVFFVVTMVAYALWYILGKVHIHIGLIQHKD